ncbi:MAG: thioredoxin domain-containing protein [Candidatus Poribacteria bacterium]|nr:thioredoxin domain-containing protein [Candidatus Poribacteria bacterium]
MKPVVSEIAIEYRDVFAIAKLDVNDNPIKTAEYHIRGTPTYKLFYKGNVARTILGAMPKERLVEQIFVGLISVIQEPLTQEQTDSE